MVITTAGMIGIGKTSVSKIIAEHLNSEVFLEQVEKNPLLELFYRSTEEENKANRYPFLLQIFFLNTRFASIKQALLDDNNVLDRSIYEDWYFAYINKKFGRISDIEFQLYEDLSSNMMEEIEGMPKKSPDLMIYLYGSFETVLNRIKERSRDYELDPNLVEYYRVLWEGYGDWVENHYTASPILYVNMDELDVVHNEEDKQKLLNMVDEHLAKIRNK